MTAVLDREIALSGNLAGIQRRPIPDDLAVALLWSVLGLTLSALLYHLGLGLDGDFPMILG